MTPLELTLEGFIGIRSGLGVDAVHIDLPTDAQLVAIIGPNGAGKTTVLDNLHPYRVMPSRASSYSPAAFSYYEHVYGNARKVLRWAHDGAEYVSTILMKADRKRPSQECYLMIQSDDGQAPYTLPDGTTSDGKAATYDACIEHILGSPEMFFTAAFACQGRRTLADYANADIKAMMTDLLGLESIRALSTRAGEVTKLARLQLDGIRSRVERAGIVDRDITATRQSIEAADEQAQDLTAARGTCRDILSAAQRRLAEAQSEHANHAEIDRRRASLKQQMATVVEHEAEAKREAIAAGDTSLAQVNREAQTARERSTRLSQQKEAAHNRIMQNTALLNQKIAIEAAVQEILRLEARLTAEREALAAARAEARARDDLVAAAREADGEVTAKQRAYNQLSTQIDQEQRRAGLIDTVPCAGTDLQPRCDLLRDAVAAKERLSDLHAQRDRMGDELAEMKDEAQRAHRQVAAAPIPDTDAIEKHIADVERDLRTAEATAAKKDACDAAEAAIQADRDEWNTLTTEQDAADEQVLEAGQRTTEIIEARDQRLAEIGTRYQAQHDALKAEYDALPPTDAAGLAAAEQAAADAQRALDETDAKLSEAQSTAAGERGRLEALLTEQGELRAAVGQATRLEDEIAHWTLITKALGNDGVIALCIDDAGPAIAGLANDLLARCYGPRFSVSITTQEETRKGETRETFDIVVHDADRDEVKSIGQVSGGERIWINEAMTRAIALYLAESSGRNYGCIFSDESDGALDIDKKRQFAAMKRLVLELGGYEREFFISHSPEVREVADAVIDVAALPALAHAA